MKNKYNLTINNHIYLGPFTLSMFNVYELEKSANNYDDQVETIARFLGATVDVLELDNTKVIGGMTISSIRRTKVGNDFKLSIWITNET